MTDDWLRRYRPVESPAMRLVAFPHAGASASRCRWWLDHLPAGVELVIAQLPGREDRIREDPVEDMAAAVDSLAAALLPLADRPLVLFGHSLGAALAHGVARRLAVVRPESVAALVVSSREAPSVHALMPPVGDVGDDVLWAEIERVGGTDREVLDSELLREVLLPTLRSDYRLSDSDRPWAEPALTCPVLAVLGDADDMTEVDVRPWAEVTAGRFEVLVFPGGHFYLDHWRPELVRAVLSYALIASLAVSTP